MGLASLRALMVMNPFVILINTIGLIFVSRQTRQYSAEELWGNSLVARHTILPAWRPLLISLSQFLAIVSILQIIFLGIFATLRWSSSKSNRLDAWAWTDLNGIIIIMFDGIVPLTVTQHAVTRDVFRRSAAFCGSHFLINFGLWAIRLGLKDHGSSIYTTNIFQCVSAALLASAGIIPAIFLILIITGIYATRLRVHSRTHRAAFLLFFCLVITWSISFVLRFNTLHPPASLANPITLFAYILSFLMLIIQIFFPLATLKTLIADTKFWRGLGKYNANARFGDVRLSELCVQRSSNELTTIPTSPIKNIPTTNPPAAVVHPVIKQDDHSDDETSIQQDKQSLPTEVEVRRTIPKNNINNFGDQHTAIKSKRPRPEMGLEIASAKLQDIIEGADRDRRMLDFEHLNIESKVIGKGTTAYVYRGKYREDRVAIKVFNPSEITEEYVDELGKELHLVATLRHRNVLALYGLCVRPPQLFAVFELCDGGSLASALADLKFYDLSLGGFIDRRLVWAFDAASAVAYLHTNAIWHRDIKIDNFLVATGTTATVKLCDFGVSLRRSTALSRGEIWATHGLMNNATIEAIPKTPVRRYASDMYNCTTSKIAASRISETFIAPLRRRRSTAPARTTSNSCERHDSLSPPPLSSGSAVTPTFSSNTNLSESSVDNQPLETNNRPVQRVITPPYSGGDNSTRSSSSSPTNKLRTPRYFHEPLDDGQPLVIVGTVAYMAPELIEARRDYNEAVDIYALGVVLRCLWCRDPEPWPREAQTFEIYDKVTNGQRPRLPDDIPLVLSTIINQAWHQDPAQRPDAETLRRDMLAAISQHCGGQTAISRLKQHVTDSNADGSRLLHRKSFVDKLLFASLWRSDENQLDQDLEDLEDPSRSEVLFGGPHSGGTSLSALSRNRSPPNNVSFSSEVIHSSTTSHQADEKKEDNVEFFRHSDSEEPIENNQRSTSILSTSTNDTRPSDLALSFQSSVTNTAAIHCENNDYRDTTLSAFEGMTTMPEKDEEEEIC